MRNGDIRTTDETVRRAAVLMLVLALAGMSFWLPQLKAVLSGLLTGDPDPVFINRDFANYWLSGRQALAGDIEPLFFKDQYQELLEQTFAQGAMETRNWSYPPHFLLLTAPMGFFSYRAAYLLFECLSLALFVWACFVTWLQWHQSSENVAGPSGPPTSFPAAILFLSCFVVAQFYIGQNGFLFGGLFLLALAWRQTKPIACGLVLALLTMKPQLGILFPFLLLAERNFGAIFWAVAFTLLLFALSVAAFGFESWELFISETLSYQQRVMREWSGVFLYMMPTFFAALRATGLTASTALLVHLMIALPVLILTLWLFFSTRAARFENSVLLAGATFVITPYAFFYDAGPLYFLAVLSLLQSGQQSGARRRLWAPLLLALLAAQPLWLPALPLLAKGTLVAPALALLAPLAVLALFVVVVSYRLRLQKGRQ